MTASYKKSITMKKLRLVFLLLLLFSGVVFNACDETSTYPITGRWMLTQFDDCGEMFDYDPYYDGYYLTLNADGSYEQYMGQQRDYGRWTYNAVNGDFVLSSIHGSNLYGHVIRLDNKLIIEYTYPDGYYEVEYYERW